jgi:DNA-binding CsgD family transcriptional regulator
MARGSKDIEGADTKARSFRPGRQQHLDEVPCLAVVEGERTGTVVPVPLGTSGIGRGPGAHLQLLDEGVSRMHAVVELTRDGIVTVVDRGSTNGTFVNGSRVEKAAVRDGDRIQVGPNVTLRFGYRTRQELGMRTPASTSPTALPLRRRELEVARMAARGLSNAEIAASLHISAATVKTHLRNIYERLDVHSRVALSRRLLEHGLAEEP